MTRDLRPVRSTALTPPARPVARRGSPRAPTSASPRQAVPPRTPRAAAAEVAVAGAPFVQNYLGYLLGQANHALYKDFDARVRAAGLSFIEWRVLATLHDSAPLTVSVLAQEVLSKQPTVTKLVQRMCEQGLLALQADAADQRRTLVSATTRGRRLVRPLVAEARAHESRILGTLSAAETAALKTLLARVAGHAAS